MLQMNSYRPGRRLTCSRRCAPATPGSSAPASWGSTASSSTVRPSRRRGSSPPPFRLRISSCRAGPLLTTVSRCSPGGSRFGAALLTSRSVTRAVEAAGWDWLLPHALIARAAATTSTSRVNRNDIRIGTESAVARSCFRHERAIALFRKCRWRETPPAMGRSLPWLCAIALAFAAVAVAPAAAPAWAPAGQATVHPGVQTFTDGAQCTSNFVFSDGTTVYLAQAAHCSGTGGQTDSNGCTSGSLPIGTPVDVTGASKPGTLVYNSWLTMQAKGESDPDTCQYNDLALVEIDPADVGSVNPSVPGFGGPTGAGGAGSGETVYSYGNSELRGGVTKLSPKQGIVAQVDGNGWSRTVYTVTPGIPGDSGSGFLNSSGEAIGVLSTLQVLPLAGSNGVGDLAKELAYMQANSAFSSVQLVQGTQPFSANLVGAILGA